MAESLLLKVVAKNTPLATPMGIENKSPVPTINKVPTIACAIPPPLSPTALGKERKKSRFKARPPFIATDTRMMKRGATTKIADNTTPKENSEFKNLRLEDAMRSSLRQMDKSFILLLLLS
jgi:hypothetical protein